MFRLLLLNCALLIAITASAKSVTVKNAGELLAANNNASPGDEIILATGDWKDVLLRLDCSGKPGKPITFRAAAPGKVRFIGHSNLKIGGTYIIVDGLNFTEGYAGDEAVIDFRLNKTKVANHCRVTNCLINDFNNFKRLDENYWVSFSGKKNRIDHCSFLNKKNLGVLMAITLEDDDSRGNFHSIDHNYFGIRPPLASNGGEMIRVGVSQHYQYNSNTQIIDNYFEHCDGETEIISIKSGSNVVRNNLFKECQGGVVLRHGDNNTVENNIFLGNGKAGTGGVRVINKGQWVVNNLFYQCRGTDFRSPLSVMNGVPNSPANRYVPVEDAVIINNSFVNSTPISFGEGSDTERSVAPDRVVFEKNIFYNDRDKKIYQAYDKISGFAFRENYLSKTVAQPVTSGFIKTLLKAQSSSGAMIPVNVKRATYVNDSLADVAKGRLSAKLNSSPGFSNAALLARIKSNAERVCGVSWLKRHGVITTSALSVRCKTTEDIIAAIAFNSSKRINIILSGSEYEFSNPLVIGSNIKFSGQGGSQVVFTSNSASIKSHLFELAGGGELTFDHLNLDLRNLQQAQLITTDTSGSSNHCNFSMKNCLVSNFQGIFFYAAKSSVADSIIVRDCSFTNNSTLFDLGAETDKKGYYNVEQFAFINSRVTNQHGALIVLVRTGNDESTMGPNLKIAGNTINSGATARGTPFIDLYGVQHSYIKENVFTNVNPAGTLIRFEDPVRADHILENNKLSRSGLIVKDKFVRN